MSDDKQSEERKRPLSPQVSMLKDKFRKVMTTYRIDQSDIKRLSKLSATYVSATLGNNATTRKINVEMVVGLFLAMREIGIHPTAEFWVWFFLKKVDEMPEITLSLGGDKKKQLPALPAPVNDQAGEYSATTNGNTPMEFYCIGKACEYFGYCDKAMASCKDLRGANFSLNPPPIRSSVEPKIAALTAEVEELRQQVADMESRLRATETQARLLAAAFRSRAA